MVKKAVDHSGETKEEARKRLSLPEDVALHVKGIAGGVLPEPLPKFNRTESEKVIEGQNNTFIVLGRDRPGSRVSGYGGVGDTQSGMIDLVVGRLGPEVRSDVWADNDLTRDSARVYLSQKTDIDEIFRISEGKVGNSIAKSGIGIKADAVRLIAREGIKLVTGTDAVNSKGGTVDSVAGIDLIAGNDGRVARKAGESGLQPIVKSINTEEALDRMLKLISSLGGILSAFLQAQMKYNSTLGTHFHTSPFYGISTTPSSTASEAASTAQVNLMNDCISGLQKHKANISSVRNTYLRTHGKKYIGSRFNSVN